MKEGRATWSAGWRFSKSRLSPGEQPVADLVDERLLIIRGSKKGMNGSGIEGRAGRVIEHREDLHVVLLRNLEDVEVLGVGGIPPFKIKLGAAGREVKPDGHEMGDLIGILAQGILAAGLI